jgi:excisionase family DNA binding protein
MSLQRRFKKPPAAPVVPVINGPRLLSLKQSADYLGAHLWAIRQMIRNREIPYVQIGRKFLIDRFDLDRYIEKNKVGIAA